MEVLIQEVNFMKSECKAKMKSEKSLLTHLNYVIINNFPVSLYNMKKLKNEMKN